MAKVLSSGDASRREPSRQESSSDTAAKLNQRNHKHQWVKKHLGVSARKRLILSQHKHLNLGDYLIDDRTVNGAGEFQGVHIHFGQEKFPNWKSVLDYLL